MEEFKTIILGNMSVWVFLAYFTLAMLAALLRAGIRADIKKHNSKDTPNNFEWGFFIVDNLQKFFSTALMIGFAIRFSNEFLGSEITGWGSVLIGLGIHEIALKIEKTQCKARE